MTMTREQEYWSLNGAFSAYGNITKLMNSGQIKYDQHLYDNLVAALEHIDKKMSEFEDELGVVDNEMTSVHPTF